MTKKGKPIAVRSVSVMVTIDTNKAVFVRDRGGSRRGRKGRTIIPFSLPSEDVEV